MLWQHLHHRICEFVLLLVLKRQLIWWGWLRSLLALPLCLARWLLAVMPLPEAGARISAADVRWCDMLCLLRSSWLLIDVGMLCNCAMLSWIWPARL
jgi:hypothetical protein